MACNRLKRFRKYNHIFVVHYWYIYNEAKKDCQIARFLIPRRSIELGEDSLWRSPARTRKVEQLNGLRTIYVNRLLKTCS